MEKAGPRFACDAMLGGLARWLRAAGYDASWHDGIDDGELVRLCAAEGRVLLTSDGGIFLRTPVRDATVPSLFVPRHVAPEDQLAHVLKELGLPAREPRCMACGGELVRVAKASVEGRIPARTFAWLEEFWECDRCGKVFWQGSHWGRIAARLPQLVPNFGPAADEVQPNGGGGGSGVVTSGEQSKADGQRRRD